MSLIIHVRRITGYYPGGIQRSLYGETPPRCPSPYSLPFLTEYVPHFRISSFDKRIPLSFRDGPLENLWGGRAKYKKNIRARQN